MAKPTIRIMLYLDPEIYDWVEATAKIQGTTLNGLITKLIEQAKRGE